MVEPDSKPAATGNCVKQTIIIEIQPHSNSDTN